MSGLAGYALQRADAAAGAVGESRMALAALEARVHRLEATALRLEAAAKRAERLLSVAAIAALLALQLGPEAVLKAAVKIVAG